MKARSEDRPDYRAEPASTGSAYRLDEDATIAAALDILTARMRRGTVCMSAPSAVRDYLRLHIGGREHEVFVALWLDAQNCLIATEDLFCGTLTQTSVYPRECVKAGLAVNAGAVIFAHNHPSGCGEPSRADEQITSALRTALALVDIKVLDHFIVTAESCTSFAERGLI